MLPLAAAIALFPIPILAALTMLSSPRAHTNVPAYLFGWVAGIAGVLTIAALLTSGVDISSEDEKTGIGWVRIVIGAALLFFAAKKWLARPRTPDDAEIPGWMSAINGFSIIQSISLGLALSAINPKNLALVASAGTAVGYPGLSLASAIVLGVLFTCLATLGLAIPVLYHVIAGDRGKEHLDNLLSWLIANNTVVMAVLMVLIGVVLIGEGIRLL